jgi:SAM-dependent methyltransferase
MDNAEDDIIRSWHVNAGPWTETVRAQGIASRRLVTDQAVVDAVHAVAPRRVLDIGCGEGWLARTLQRGGMEVYGIDVVPELVAAARRLGEGEFAVHSYDDVAEGRLQRGSFDAVVCNFSLFGRESVDSLIAGIGSYLNDPGVRRSALYRRVAPRQLAGIRRRLPRSSAMVFSHFRNVVCDAATVRIRGDRLSRANRPRCLRSVIRHLRR